MSHFDCAVLLPPVEGTVEGAEALERAMAPYKEYLGDEGGGEYLEFVEDEDFDVDEGTGRRGYWENPNARWDLFVVGGRWGGKLRLGDGGRSDVAAVADVVADVDPAAYDMALERYRPANALPTGAGGEARGLRGKPQLGRHGPGRRDGLRGEKN